MKLLCTLMVAAFLALMFAAYPHKSAVGPTVVSSTKPVILYRAKPILNREQTLLAQLYFANDPDFSPKIKMARLHAARRDQGKE